MTISHHVSDALLLDYASGTLEESWSIAVATHLALCPPCRQRLSAMEDIGGAFIDRLDPEAGSESEDASWLAVRSAVLSAPEAPATTPKSPARDDSAATVPEPLRSYLGVDYDKLKWRPLGLGAYHYPIPTGDKSISTRLLRIPAGKPVPEHGHGGRELTLVLRGSFRDGDDLFGAGDLEEADEHLEHQPIATEEEDCICLAVTDSPLKFRSRIVSLLQPLLGI
ncbi:MAG: ChrR family anti-sigma-E factor [Hyphomicrobiaceae bacterium]|nr:ChrR family anti-sigma-E factor [Hyphomicrobiaceae bacterium]MCC0023961.1 cupin domain-containing protein [Hyphomicrobiaceae bacterium]